MVTQVEPEQFGRNKMMLSAFAGNDGQGLAALDQELKRLIGGFWCERFEILTRFYGTTFDNCCICRIDIGMPDSLRQARLTPTQLMACKESTFALEELDMSAVRNAWDFANLIDTSMVRDRGKEDELCLNWHWLHMHAVIHADRDAYLTEKALKLMADQHSWVHGALGTLKRGARDTLWEIAERLDNKSDVVGTQQLLTQLLADIEQGFADITTSCSRSGLVPLPR